MTRFSAMLAVFAAACGGGQRTTDAPKSVPAGGGNITAPEAPTPSASNSAPPDDAASRKVLRMVKSEQLAWTPLVPEAGDKGPLIASMWGDMTSQPNGFFIKLPAGDKGVLHTHTNDHHGLAITAVAAAQDGGKPHTVAQGTYWYQPGGVAHLDSCPGAAPCIGFSHFTAGRFDFAPATPGTGAKPDVRYVERPLARTTWVAFDAKNPDGGWFAPLWGDASVGENGMFMKLTPGKPPFWHIHKHDSHGVVLAGTMTAQESGREAADMPVGSYWFQPGGNKHSYVCKPGADCIVYVYFTGAFDVKPAQ